jgi:ATP-binding cassette subfamily B (MDR/TAP) protein 7
VILWYHASTQFRKQANAADNQAATRIIDSLINYEAVKVG